MNKLIEILVAAVIFWIIYFYLVPLLPAPVKGFFAVIVVVIAIIYLLGELGGYNWPWKQ